MAEAPPLKGAIIGVGKIAQTAHLPALTDDRIRSRVEIVAVADPSEESRRMVAATHPHLRLYSSYGELFERERPDFIDVCAPPRFHAEIIRAALGRGVHILCEKPFASSLPEARRLRRELLADREVVFAPCHQYRYSPLWQELKTFIDGHPSDNRWLLQFNVFRIGADPGLLSDGTVWRVDRAMSGGGILADTGVHYLYLASWLMGDPVNITARGFQLTPESESVEDTAMVVLESARGAAQINLTWGAHRRANSAFLVSRAGSLEYDGTALVKHTAEGRETIAVPDASDKAHYVSLYVSLIDGFLNAIGKREDHTPWIEDAYGSIRLLHACYRSADTGKTIRVDSTL